MDCWILNFHKLSFQQWIITYRDLLCLMEHLGQRIHREASGHLPSSQKLAQGETEDGGNNCKFLLCL